jgi:hypothetical protein
MGHLGQAEAFAAELRAATRRSIIEVVDVARRNGNRSHLLVLSTHQRPVRFSGRGVSSIIHSARHGVIGA